MQAVRRVVGTALPLDRSDVDTDQIIPSEWLKRVDRSGFGEGLFSEWREEADFVLNRPEYAGAQILVAGPNFGTGSSREHAVWALTDYGFRAVVSPAFGDIFRENSTKAGLVPVQVPVEFGERLMRAVAADSSLQVIVDVEAAALSVPARGWTVEFPLDEFDRYRMINGLDDIALTERRVGEIKAFEDARPAWMPRVDPGDPEVG